MNEALVRHADEAMVKHDRIVAKYRFSAVGLTADPKLKAHADKALAKVKKPKSDKGHADFDTEAYFALLREGKPPIMAAREVGANPELVQRRMKFDRAFREAAELAESEAAERIEEMLYTLAMKGEKWAMQEWLKKRYKDRWGDDPTVVQHQGTVNHEIGAAPLLDQIAALEAVLKGRAELTEGNQSDSIDIVDAEIVEDDEA